jgi:DNA mismatch repair protein MSH5
MTRR